ncbi:hypothetical protein OPV22_029229 [Ensete ventricosum]|nr:hypothetical protein OPV22_029229 [Ensete ventricosum]
MSAVISGLVNVIATFVSIITVDKVGRRVLFLQGGVQMVISQILVGTLIGIKFGTTGQGEIPKTYAIFVIFLSLLCHLKFGLFYFFAAWEVAMTVFIALFLPETKNIPIEEMGLVWKKHWFWSRYVNDDTDV